ncbi:MAG TPA: NADPH-dependent FMN reductase [Gaiellaceae bacterium]
MKLLSLSGSLRRDSFNTKLLRAAEELLPPEVEVERWGGLKEVPPYDEEDDVRPAPRAVSALRDAIAAADAVLVSTPEYNSSIPGQLKNALDWVSRPLAESPLRNKPVVVVGASTGAFGAVWAQAELRKVLAAIGARVVDAEVAVGHAPTRFDEHGKLVDEAMVEQLDETLDELLAAAAARAGREAVAA